MKNILILTAIGAIITAPAIAVQKCVALNNNTSCKVGKGATYGYADWTLTCTTGTTTVPISGIGVCSNQAGNAAILSTTLEYTAISNATDPNQCYTGDARYCWCRMLSPAVSQWVYSGLEMNTESDCLYKCARECQTYIVNEAVLRRAMFYTSTLSD